MRRASTLSFQESNHFSASGGFYSEFEGDTGIHEVESGSPEKSSSFPDPESPESTPPAFPESDHYSEFSPEPAINSLASGYSEYDVQGKVRKSFSTFIHSSFSETAPVPVKTAVQNCPAPLNAQSVYIDSSNQIQDHVVCATDITLDSLGRAWKQTSPDGTSTMVHHEGPFKTTVYDENDFDGTTDSPRTIEKDAHGRLYSITDWINKSAGTKALTVYTWDPIGNLTSLSRKNGVDPSGEPTFITKTQYFNSIGEKLRIVDPDAGEWTFTYDEVGNLQSHTDPRQTTISYAYDDSNRMIMEFCSAGPDGSGCGAATGPTVTYVYDTAYRMVGGKGYMPLEATDAEGNEVEQKNLLGNLSYVIGKNTKNFFSYDERGRQIAEGRALSNTGYFPGVQEQQGTEETAYYVSFVEYDDLDRVTKQIYPGNTPDAAVTVCNTYNYRGLLATTNDCNGTNYQNDFRRKTFTRRQAFFRRKNAESQNFPYHSIVYDRFGRRLQYKLGDSAQTTATMSYNIRGLLYEAHRSNLAGYDLTHRRYTYDKVGNITFIEDLRTNPLYINGQADKIFDISMSYDSINQLLTTDYTYTDGTLDSVPFRSMQYAYDILGNLTQKNTVRRSMQGQTLLEEPNPADEFYKTWFGTASYGAGGNAGPDAMSSAGDGAGNSITINYDNAGNMLDLTVLSTSDGSKVFTYEWDEFNRLKYAKRTGTNVSDYEALYNYDYGSVRIGKIEKKLVDQTVNYETTLYVNDAVEERLIRKSASLTEYELVRYIFDGSRLLRLDWNNTGSDSAFTRRWMHPDHLGTASLISNDAGDAESITIYLPYGAVLEEKSETGFRDPYGFTGKELEVDLGIMYFGARWYNPQLGRWLSPDPLYLVSTAKNGEKEQNLYHYAANNPWKFVDPNGLWNDLTLPGIYKGHRNMGKSPTEAAECTATVYRRAGAMALITAAAIGGAAIASKIAAIVTVYQVAVKSYIALSVMSVAQKVNLNRALTSFQNYFATLSRTISQNRLAISIKDVSILAKEQIKYFNAIGSHNRVIYKITEQVTKNNVVIDKLAKLREKAIAVGGNTRWGLHESRFFNNIKDHFKYSDQIAYFMEKSGYIFRWPSGKIMQHTTEIRNLVINAKKFLKAYENSKVKLWPKEMQIYYKELSNHARKVVDFVDKVDKATKK